MANHVAEVEDVDMSQKQAPEEPERDEDEEANEKDKQEKTKEDSRGRSRSPARGKRDSSTQGNSSKSSAAAASAPAKPAAVFHEIKEAGWQDDQGGNGDCGLRFEAAAVAWNEFPLDVLKAPHGAQSAKSRKGSLSASQVIHRQCSGFTVSWISGSLY